MSQKSLLIDIQGEMMGHAGQIYFAVVSPALFSNLATTERQGYELTSTEWIDGTLDSAASTMDTATTNSIPMCPGGTLDSAASTMDTATTNSIPMCPGGTLDSAASTMDTATTNSIPMCPGGTLDSAASTMDTATTNSIPTPVSECAGFILDMQSEARIGSRSVTCYFSAV